jgi:hypothetical protein
MVNRWKVIGMWCKSTSWTNWCANTLGEPNDYFCGGNMFVYYSVQQAEAVKTSKPAYKGPAFFVVRGVDGRKLRRCWVAWQ